MKIEVKNISGGQKFLYDMPAGSPTIVKVLGFEGRELLIPGIGAVRDTNVIYVVEDSKRIHSVSLNTFLTNLLDDKELGSLSDLA